MINFNDLMIPEGIVTKIEIGGNVLWEKNVTPVTSTPYLTFESVEPFTLNNAAYSTPKSWDGILQYSTDAETWNEWDGKSSIASAEYNDAQVLYMRGIGNTTITKNSSSYKWKLSGSDIKCIGNIENLLDYETVANGNRPTMATGCYAYLFNSCTSLITAPTLPATTLVDYCYYHMFTGCTGLTTAPTLPATTLADHCYAGMFRNCTALTVAPELPATTLADGCYSSMFEGCTGLTVAPALPITTLADTCYNYMFDGCTGLTVAPDLPATTLTLSCYSYMFRNCTGLTNAPELPAMNLATSCYRGMFEGCTGLTVAPDLPATTLDSYCYGSMFQHCNRLITLPELPATTLANYCYDSMFYGCVNLRLSTVQTEGCATPYRIPASGTGVDGTDSLRSMFDVTSGTFTGTPSINTIYYIGEIVYPDTVEDYLTFASTDTFTIGVKNSMKNWNGSLYYSTDTETWTEWDGSTVIVSAEHSGEQRIYMCGKKNSIITGYGTYNSTSNKYTSEYSWVLTGSNIRSIGNIETLLDYGVVASGVHPGMRSSCYDGMFNECTSLILAPELPATTLSNSCYAYMFCRCTGLTATPKLPAMTLTGSCYKYMFFACSKLTTATALPATTLATRCYDHMFSSCSGLVTLPALPATALVSGCYNDMFSDCSKIKISKYQSEEYTIPYMVPSGGNGEFSDTSAVSCMYAMFWYAGGSTSISWLDLNTTYYVHESNTIV